MGQQKEAPKNGDAKKVVTVVLKMELHCEGCAKKVKDAVKGYEDVQSVKTDCEANKVTVVGKVNPVKIKKILEEKTKKEVELISPQPKKEAAAGGGVKKAKEDKPPNEQKEAPKNGDAKKVVTVVLKMELHCEGCAKKVKDAVKGYEDVQSVKTDCEANKVTVVGKVNPVKIKKILEEKTKKEVELISPQPKKEAAAGGGVKKAKENKPPKEPKAAPKNDDAKKDDITVVFHCEGCAKKVKVTVKR